MPREPPPSRAPRQLKRFIATGDFSQRRRCPPPRVRRIKGGTWIFTSSPAGAGGGGGLSKRASAASRRSCARGRTHAAPARPSTSLAKAASSSTACPPSTPPPRRRRLSSVREELAFKARQRSFSRFGLGLGSAALGEVHQLAKDLRNTRFHFFPDLRNLDRRLVEQIGLKLSARCATLFSWRMKAATWSRFCLLAELVASWVAFGRR